LIVNNFRRVNRPPEAVNSWSGSTPGWRRNTSSAALDAKLPTRASPGAASRGQARTADVRIGLT
jgi:hypothetical protein